MKKEGLKKLCEEFSNITNLKLLKIGESEIFDNDETLNIFINSLKLISNLSTLWINASSLQDDGIKILSNNFVNISRLTELNIGGNIFILR